MNGDETAAQEDPLLDAAESLIYEEGAEGWTLGDLADRAGVTPEAVESRFDSE